MEAWITPCVLTFRKCTWLIQREIIARLDRERRIVEGNRELIRLYEEKVRKVIKRVWEG